MLSCIVAVRCGHQASYLINMPPKIHGPPPPQLQPSYMDGGGGGVCMLFEHRNPQEAFLLSCCLRAYTNNGVANRMYYYFVQGIYLVNGYICRGILFVVVYCLLWYIVCRGIIYNSQFLYHTVIDILPLGSGFGGCGYKLRILNGSRQGRGGWRVPAIEALLRSLCAW